MPNSIPIIRFEQVSVNAEEKTLLSNISFSLWTGEKAVLCGKSGSGKTTLLRTLFGLQSIKSGSVYFQQQPLNAATVHMIRSRIAYIGQEPVLGADTVRESLLLPFKFKAHRDAYPADSQLIAALHRLKLNPAMLGQACSRISGGEKQRIALARGLLLGKSLYLLDEVTSALDIESKQAVFEVFSDPQLTVLSIAHDSDWLKLCSTILELDDGKLIKVQHGNA